MHSNTQLKNKRQKNTMSFFTATVIASCALSLLSARSFAQKGFDFGLRAEVQSSALMNATDNAAGPELDLAYKAAFAYGIGVGYTFSDHMGVEVDVMPSTQGQSYKGDPTKIDPTVTNVFCYDVMALAADKNIPLTGTSYTADVIMSVIKIPILFRLTGVCTRSSYFTLLVGPQIDMLSSAKFKINGSDAGSSTTGYNKTTFDGVLAPGVAFNVSDNILVTGHFRMDYGFGDIEDKSKWGNGRAATHNITAGLMVGVSYKLSKKDDAKGGAKSKK